MDLVNLLGRLSDTYVTPVKTKLTATRSDLIEQMIKTAESYLGTEYVVGAAGVPGSGIDCSGLVMQAMYSIGIDPAPVSVTRGTLNQDMSLNLVIFGTFLH